MESKIIKFDNGKEVELREFWACDNDVFAGSESGTYTDVIDTATGDVITTVGGGIPEDSTLYDLCEIQEYINK